MYIYIYCTNKYNVQLQIYTPAKAAWKETHTDVTEFLFVSWSQRDSGEGNKHQAIIKATKPINFYESSNFVYWNPEFSPIQWVKNKNKFSKVTINNTVTFIHPYKMLKL